MKSDPTLTAQEFSSRARKTTVRLSLEHGKDYRKVTAQVFHAEFTTHARPGSLVVSPSGAVELRAETRTGKDEPKGNYELMGFYPNAERAEKAHVYKAIDYLTDADGAWTRFFAADQPFLSESLDELLVDWHLAETAKAKPSRTMSYVGDTIAPHSQDGVDAMKYAFQAQRRNTIVQGFNDQSVALISPQLVDEAQAALYSPEPNINQMETLTRRLIAALELGKMKPWAIANDALGTSVVQLHRAENVAFPLGGR